MEKKTKEKEAGSSSKEEKVKLTWLFISLHLQYISIAKACGPTAGYMVQC